MPCSYKSSPGSTVPSASFPHPTMVSIYFPFPPLRIVLTEVPSGSLITKSNSTFQFLSYFFFPSPHLILFIYVQNLTLFITP